MDRDDTASRAESGEVVRIVLPWPHRGLHPNARTHWAPKAKLIKAARSAAKAAAERAAENLGLGEWAEGAIPVTLTFLPPDRRGRDLDGMLSQCKAYLDGVAEGLGVNDKRFRPALQLGTVAEGGRVVVDVVYFGRKGTLERGEAVGVGTDTPEWLLGL